MSLITFSLSPDNSDEIIISSPYDAREAIKSLPKRRWDPDLKAWIIPYWMEGQAIAVLEEAGFRISGTSRLERDLRAANATIREMKHRLVEDSFVQRRSYSSGDPFADLDKILPRHLRGSVYRALIRVLHPDAGGNTELAQQLNNSPLARRSRQSA